MVARAQNSLETIQDNDTPIASPRDGECKANLAAPWIREPDEGVMDAIDLHYSSHPLRRQAQLDTQKGRLAVISTYN